MTTRHSKLTTLIKERLPKSSSNKIKANLDFLFYVIKLSLKKDKKLIIQDFGTFELKEQNRKRFRNPNTGEEVIKERSVTVKFIPSKNFIEEIVNDCKW